MATSTSSPETLPISRNGPINVLSLDGGGVRGLSALQILHKLMIQLQLERQCEEIPLPWREFDLIVGTSTGGIIALMLGRLRMSTSDAISVYRRFVKKVFGGFLAKLKYIRLLIGASMYSALPLMAALKETASEDKLEDIGGCKTAVVTARHNDQKRPILLRSYAHPSYPADTCEIWKAGRATSAASVFFPPVSIGDPPCRYIDGAFSGHCNPAELALEEVDALWGPKPGRPLPSRHLGCLLSIGTGSPSTHSFTLWPHKLLSGLARLVTDCSSVDERLTMRYKDHEPSPYFRFSVADGLQNVRLDDWKKCVFMEEITASYMGQPRQMIQARCCVQRLNNSAAALKK
jgi:hypothetical protein